MGKEFYFEVSSIIELAWQFEIDVSFVEKSNFVRNSDSWNFKSLDDPDCLMDHIVSHMLKGHDQFFLVGNIAIRYSRS